MRQLRLASVLVGGLFLIGAAGVSGQTWGEAELPRSGVCFYENPNFAGRYFCASIGDSTPMVPEGMNDRISSIRVLGDAEVAVYKDRDFRGEARTVRQDLRDLREAGLNDRISSFRVSGPRGWDGPREGRERGEMSWGHPGVPRSGVCFYENPNFAGRYFCASTGDSTPMVPEGMNDRISSIQVLGEAEVAVYKDRDFRGESRIVRHDLRDLREAGLNDRISSFRVSAGGEWEGRSEGGDGEMRWGHPRVPRSGVCFYEHPNFGGRYFCAAVGDSAPMVPGGMNDRISSIRIFGRAEVSVFRDGSFRGEARRFGRNMPDLRGIGFNDRISSFRVDGRRPRRRY